MNYSIKSSEKPIIVDDSLPPYQGDNADTQPMEPHALESAAERLGEELEEPLYETGAPKAPCQMLRNSIDADFHALASVNFGRLQRSASGLAPNAVCLEEGCRGWRGVS